MPKARIQFDASLLVDLMRVGQNRTIKPVVDAIPRDATITRVTIGPKWGQIEIELECPTFPEVEHGEVPLLRPRFEVMR